MVEKTVPKSFENQTSGPQEITRSQTRYVAPPVDIYEEIEKLVVIADLPGADKESVRVNVEKNILTLDATTKSMASGNPIYREYEMVNFYRQFELSEEVDSAKISADLKNGVLTLHLPKMEKAKPKLIEIQIKD